MDNSFDDIAALAARCENAAQPFHAGPVHDQLERLFKAIDSLNQAWSGSWLGYQSALYINGLRPRGPGEHFDTHWGLKGAFTATRGAWREYSYEEIKNTIMARASVSDVTEIMQAAEGARRTVHESKEALIPLFDALLSVDEDKAIQTLRNDIDNVSGVTRDSWINAKRPQEISSADSIALDQYVQGYPPPPHLGLEGWLVATVSLGRQAEDMARLARRAEQYMRQKDRIKASSAITPQEPDLSNPVTMVERLAGYFHLFVGQLRHRHAKRPELEINDEYDVQDAFHALLRLFFDDIRDEEWTPSYAGGSSRIDFLLTEEEIVIEVKKTRLGLRDKEVGEQLLIDIQRYQAHQRCKVLVIFIYDPDKLIRNPAGLIRDLGRREHDVLEVRVIINRG